MVHVWLDVIVGNKAFNRQTLIINKYKLVYGGGGAGGSEGHEDSFQSFERFTKNR